MIHLNSHDPELGGMTRVDSQPIALAAVLLLLIVSGIGGMALWRATSDRLSDADRAAFQSSTAQASEQLVERTRGIEVTQQESIDQLQSVQDELQTVKRQLASQQADNKRLTNQMSALADAVDGLRQSFASAPPDTLSEPATRNRPLRTRADAMHLTHRKRAKLRS